MTERTVAITGEIDTSRADELKAALYAAIDANPGTEIVVDFADVQFMDSTGLGTLVSALKHARSADGDLCIVNAPPRIWRLFTITGLDKVFATR
jgi:anti-sigma B factor antagonist